MKLMPTPHLAVNDIALYRPDGTLRGMIVRITSIRGGSAGEHNYFDTDPPQGASGAWGKRLTKVDPSSVRLQLATFLDQLSRDPRIVNGRATLGEETPTLTSGTSIAEVLTDPAERTWTAVIDGEQVAEVTETSRVRAIERLAEAVRRAA